jgi:hypothetical protein
MKVLRLLFLITVIFPVAILYAGIVVIITIIQHIISISKTK